MLEQIGSGKAKFYGQFLSFGKFSTEIEISTVAEGNSAAHAGGSGAFPQENFEFWLI